MISRLGAVLVITASTVWGCLAAQRFTERCRLLQIWIWAVEIIKTEIYFQSQLLPEVFRKVAVMVNDREIARLFAELATTAEYGSPVGFTAGWKVLLAQARWKSLKPPEREILQQLGMFLGGTDRRDQLAKLNAGQVHLEQTLATATTEQRRQVGLYRYLGFAAGATLVLLTS
jgi:stage III sporulation protein AB